MNAKEIRATLEEAGFKTEVGSDAATFWIVVPASESDVRFAVVSQKYRVEFVFRFGHLDEPDRDTLLDLLFLNHETTHFRVALNKHNDLFLFSTWPPDDLEPELLKWLIDEFAVTCERINDDLADLTA